MNELRIFSKEEFSSFPDFHTSSRRWLSVDDVMSDAIDDMLFVIDADGQEAEAVESFKNTSFSFF